MVPPSSECVEICKAHQPVVQEGNESADWKCSRDIYLAEDDFFVEEIFKEISGEDDWSCEGISSLTNSLVKDYFERGEPDKSAIDLDTVFVLLTADENKHLLQTPPPSFKTQNVLQEMKVSESHVQSQFARQKNEQIDKMAQNQAIELFGNTLWSSCCRIAKFTG